LAQPNRAICQASNRSVPESCLARCCLSNRNRSPEIGKTGAAARGLSY
jgi:hypothetical protein